MIFKSLKYLLLTSFVFSFTSCKDVPPVIPGLSSSTIMMFSYPDSAQVYLNNQLYKYLTPLPLSDLNPGFYKVDLHKQNYLDTSIYYLIRRGVTDTLSVQLREDPKYWWKAYTRFNSSLPTDLISKIRVDANNDKWIGTRGFGLIKFNGTTFTLINASNSGLPDNYINDILILPGNIMWIATTKGLCRYDGTTWRVYNKQNSNLTDEYLTCVAFDKSNIIWAGTNTAGLIRFDGISFREYNIINSPIIANEVHSIFVDAANKKWIGTWGSGICMYNDSTWKSFSTYNSTLQNNYISCIKSDNAGNIWAGCSSVGSGPVGGVSTFQNNKWTNFSTKSGFPATSAEEMVFDKNNVLWAATNSGLAKYDYKQWTIFNNKNSGITNNSLVSVCLDLDQNKWLTGGGIFTYIGGK